MAPKTKPEYPLMNESEVEHICSLVNKDSTMFEWGSGNSTIFFSKIAKSISSVEHNLYWYNRIVQEIKEKEINNVSLAYVRPNMPYRHFKDGHSLLMDMRTYEFNNYINAINYFPQKNYDFFVLDGRARPQCAEMALRFCHEDSIVFMQEFYRARYSVALEWYEMEDRIENMAVLKPKKKFLNWRPKIEMYPDV